MKHNIIKPSIIYYRNKKLQSISYKISSHYHRTDGPAYTEYDKNENIIKEEYWIKGKLYKSISYSPNKKIITYLENDQYHNINGPAILTYIDDELIQEEYYIHNKRHRINAPAVITTNFNNTELRYYVNDERHREDGPAYILQSKYENILNQKYYIHNKKLSQEEFLIYKLNKVLKIHELFITYQNDMCFINSNFKLITVCTFNELEEKINNILN